MDAKSQSYWWWFDSHNSQKCSPWLQSALSELDEKTKSMLKLIEQDADSFGQRAEMYYEKRPELIKKVEDFYRTHRSLAERYDQLRHETPIRTKSPLRHSFSHFSTDLKSVRSFGSLNEEACTSEESAESEIDDPEVYDDAQVVLDFGEFEKKFSIGGNYDEVMKLREELEKLREENEIQRSQIELKTNENKKLLAELTGFKDRLLAVGRENNDMLMNLRGELEKEETEKIQMIRNFEKAVSELKKAKEEMQTAKKLHKDTIEAKDEEKREVIRQLSMGMELLREQIQLLKKAIVKDSPKKSGCSGGLGKFFGLSSKC